MAIPNWYTAIKAALALAPMSATTGLAYQDGVILKSQTGHATPAANHKVIFNNAGTLSYIGSDGVVHSLESGGGGGGDAYLAGGTSGSPQTWTGFNQIRVSEVDGEYKWQIKSNDGLTSIAKAGKSDGYGLYFSTDAKFFANDLATFFNGATFTGTVELPSTTTINNLTPATLEGTQAFSGFITFNGSNVDIAGSATQFSVAADTTVFSLTLGSKLFTIIDDAAANVLAINGSSGGKIGFFSATPVVQQPTPTTLADVIAILQTYGLAA